MSSNLGKLTEFTMIRIEISIVEQMRKQLFKIHKFWMTKTKCHSITSFSFEICEERKGRIPNFYYIQKKGKLLHYILDLYIYTCSWDPQYSKKIKGKEKKITVQYLTLPLKLEHICHMHQACYKCI